MGTPDDQAQQQAFWNEFMRTDEAQDALKGDYEEAHRESMRFVEEVVKPEQRRELGEALLSISPDLQRTIAPMLKYEFVQRILYSIFDESRKKCCDFSDKLRSPELLTYLVKLKEEIKANPGSAKSKEDQWWYSVSLQQLEKDKNSKEKFNTSRMDTHQLMELMNFCSSIKVMGNTKFQQKKYQKALDKYTQGAEALVGRHFGRSDESRMLQGMQMDMYRNQAIAALKCERWALANKACDLAIAIDGQDMKALFRKAQACVKLGIFTEAKTALLKMVDQTPNTYEEAFEFNGAKREAQKLLNNIKRRQVEANRTGKKMVQGGFLDKTFTKRRPAEEKGRHYLDRDDGRDDDDESSEPMLKPQVYDTARSYARGLARVLEVQGALKAHCASPEVAAQLTVLRRDSEFDETRFLSRARKYLKKERAAILEAHGFGSHREMEMEVGEHLRHPEVCKNSMDLLALMLGDMSDLAQPTTEGDGADGDEVAEDGGGGDGVEEAAGGDGLNAF